MMITSNTIALIRSACKPLIDAGLIPQEEFKEALKRLRTTEEKTVTSKNNTIQTVTRRQAASMLSISLRSLDRLVASGILSPRIIGKRRIVFLESDIISYLEDCEVKNG